MRISEKHFQTILKVVQFNNSVSNKLKNLADSHEKKLDKRVQLLSSQNIKKVTRRSDL